MIAFFVALEDESQGLQRHLNIVDTYSIDGAPTLVGDWQGRSVMLCRTGLGRRAEAIAGQVIERFPTKSVVSLGFAGALIPQLKIGDLLFCQQVFYANDSEDNTGEGQTVHSDPHLLALAQAAAEHQGIPHHLGASVTVSRIASPKDKRKLAKTWPAHLVEMENFWLGRVAAAHDIPFLAVRAVLDELDDWVPNANLVDETGVVQRQKVMAYLARHPGRTRDLMRLGANVGKAADSLTAWGMALLEQWEGQ